MQDPQSLATTPGQGQAFVGIGDQPTLDGSAGQLEHVYRLADPALSELARHPYGSGLLLAIAVGFACFGAFCFLDARFRRT